MNAIIGWNGENAEVTGKYITNSMRENISPSIKYPQNENFIPIIVFYSSILL